MPRAERPPAHRRMSTFANIPAPCRGCATVWPSSSRGGPVLRPVHLVGALACPLAAGTGAVPGGAELVGHLRPGEAGGAVLDDRCKRFLLALVPCLGAWSRSGWVSPPDAVRALLEAAGLRYGR